MAKSGKGAGPRQQAATEVVHRGRDAKSQHGFVNPPVYRGSTVLFPTLEALEAYDSHQYKYGRHGTPTTSALEDALTTLEGGHQTTLTASGYQAVTTAILAFVSSGKHILVADSVYQPTRAFCDSMLKSLGVTTTYYDPAIGAGIADLITPETVLVFTESPGSLTFEIQDIPAITAAASKKGVPVVIDNTWATGLYFKPLALGVAASINACTKYIVGHADAMLGAITSADAATAARIKKARTVLGVCPGSEETFLGLRGVRTLDVRLERHHKSGLEIASWLEARPEVARVIHPALPSHPGHALWKRDFKGASGLFSIILKPAPKAAIAALLDSLELFGMGYSWGGYESLIIPFNPTAYRTATKWQAEGQALRLHVGLENTADLIADLDAGLTRLKAST